MGVPLVRQSVQVEPPDGLLVQVGQLAVISAHVTLQAVFPNWEVTLIGICDLVGSWAVFCNHSLLNMVSCFAPCPYGPLTGFCVQVGPWEDLFRLN